MQLTKRDHAEEVDADARIDLSNVVKPSAAISGAIDVLIWRTGTEGLPRHHVVRTGEREPYPTHLRRLVWLRDGQRCRICNLALRFEELEVDHIVPWSAGGDHRSTNLRATCRDCNQERGNRLEIRAELRELRPVTPMCWTCIGEHPQWVKPTHPGYRQILLDEPATSVDAFCGCCGWVSPTPHWNTL